MVYRLICENTVEEYILQRAKEKLALNNAILDEGGTYTLVKSMLCVVLYVLQRDRCVRCECAVYIYIYCKNVVYIVCIVEIHFALCDFLHDLTFLFFSFLFSFFVYSQINPRKSNQKRMPFIRCYKPRCSKPSCCDLAPLRE